MIPIIILSIENEDDREFMSRLYLDYRKRMFAGILGYVSDRSAAEDVLHEAVVKLIGKVELLRTLDEERILRNLRVDELRKVWGRLSESAQDILKRKYMLMLSDEEIAEGYGIRSDAVRMRLTRARREVYALLNKGEK